MTQIPSTSSAIVALPPQTYNGVKIRVNNPQAFIADSEQNGNGNSAFNAVDIEVNNPRLCKGKAVYNYPQRKTAVPYSMSGAVPIHPDMPKLPVTYQTNLINNRTVVNAEVGIRPYKTSSETGPEETKTIVIPPEPNYTTVEQEKKLSFHGKNENTLGIEANSNMAKAPVLNVKETVKKLSSENYDEQALAMANIVEAASANPKDALPYIVTDVFSALIDIINKDTTGLQPPTSNQTEIRKKIIINELAKEKAREEKLDPKNTELPFKLTDKEIAEGMALTELEMAERNKEYALYTTAILAKIYTDEFLNDTGNVVPLTDVPGVSTFVDTLRKDKNASIKVAAINSLMYVQRPEYKDEIKTILSISASDENPAVAQSSAAVLKALDSSK